MARKTGHRVVNLRDDRSYIIFTAHEVDIFEVGERERKLIDALVAAMDDYENTRPVTIKPQETPQS